MLYVCLSLLIFYFPCLYASFPSFCMYLKFNFIKTVKKNNNKTKTKQNNSSGEDFSNNHLSNDTKTIIHLAFGE